jgi:hypothetical protein
MGALIPVKTGIQKSRTPCAPTEIPGYFMDRTLTLRGAKLHFAGSIAVARFILIF